MYRYQSYVIVGGLMDRTRDFEACDPSSIPGTTRIFFSMRELFGLKIYFLVQKVRERSTVRQGVAKQSYSIQVQIR